MQTILTWFQLLLSILLIAAVILHPAKGMGLGGIGSPAQVFGSQKGAETSLNKITATIAILWGLVAALLTARFGS